MALRCALAGATARLRGYVSASGAARRCRGDRLPRVPQGHFSIWSVRIALMWAIRARAGPTLSSIYISLVVVHMFVCYSRFGTAQSRRRTGPRKYIRGAAQILRALHLQIGFYFTPFTRSGSHVFRDHMHVFYVITHHAPAKKGVNWGVISWNKYSNDGINTVQSNARGTRAGAPCCAPRR